MKGARGDLSDFLYVVFKHRKFIFWNTFVITVGMIVATFIITPRFTAVTTILPPQGEGQGILGLSNLLQRFDVSQLSLTGATTSSQVYVAILKSRTVADSLVTRHGLTEHYDVKTKEVARRVLLSNSTVKLNTSGVIEVAVTDRDPKLAARLANDYVAELDTLNQVLSTGEGHRTRVFVEDRLRVTEARLHAAEDSLLAFQNAHPGMPLPTDVQALASASADLMARRITLGYELELLQSTMQPDAAPLVRKRTEVRALDSELDRLPTLGIELGRRYRNFKVQEKVFELLSAQLESARIKEARDVSTVTVLDRAVPPDRRSWPRRGLLTVVAFLFSLSVAVLISVAIEVLARLRASDDPRFQGLIRPGSLLDRALFRGRSPRGS